MTPAQNFLNLPDIQTLTKTLARAIIGPSNLGNFPETPEKLEKLRAIRWEQASEQERGMAEVSARAALAELYLGDFFPQ